MRFEEGDDIVVVGPNSQGISMLVGFYGEIVKECGNELEGYSYIVDIPNADSFIQFPADSLRLAEENVFDEEDKVLDFPNKNPPVAELKHVVSIQGNNFLLTTAEIKQLKNLLAAIV